MAQVARDPQLEADIEYHLNYQFGEWKSIPEIAEWWPEMDGIDREVFHLEWCGITESRLRELRQWVVEGRLTPAQQARYQDLERLVKTHRPTVERLLASG
jgi:hypothetical protein